MVATCCYSAVMMSQNYDERLLVRAINSGDADTVLCVLPRILSRRTLEITLGKNLLRLAIRNNNKELVELLLNQKPQLNTPEDKVLSVLWMAVLLNHLEIAEMLIRAGADVNEHLGPHPFYDPQSTILHVTLSTVPSRKHESLITEALNHGANIDARDSHGLTCLHYAVHMERLKYVYMFIRAGAQINAADNEGETVLHTAAHSSKAHLIVPVLIFYGADVKAKSNRDMNALHFLARSRKEHVNVAKMLLKRGVSVHDVENRKSYQPLHYATASGKIQLLKLFLEHGADVNAPAKGGMFPLYLGVKSGPAMIKFLLLNGADILQFTHRGRNVLHAACIKLAEQSIQLLLACGAQSLAKDDEGNTPFSLVQFKNLSLSNRLMLKELALIKAGNPSQTLDDEKIIALFPSLQDYFNECLEEIEEMRHVKFFDNWTFDNILTKTDHQLALMIYNQDFVKAFKNYDLDVFPKYTKLLKQAIERAEKRNKMYTVHEHFLIDAFSNRLPSYVVEKITYIISSKYVFNDFKLRYFYIK